MQDGIIKGTGNSRIIKGPPNAGTLWPTYEDFIAALAAGEVTLDLAGINPSGWTQQGTALNKGNLLTDATAAILGLTSSATVNTALANIPNAVGLQNFKDKIQVVTTTRNLTIPSAIKGPFVTIILVGGGGGAGGNGGSGYSRANVNPRCNGGMGGNGGGGGQRFCPSRSCTLQNTSRQELHDYDRRRWSGW